MRLVLKGHLALLELLVLRVRKGPLESRGQPVPKGLRVSLGPSDRKDRKDRPV